MQKWEYWTVQQGRGFGSPILGATQWTPPLDLNQAGYEGWELVSALPLNGIQGEGWSGLTNEVVWVFKRPIEE